MITITDAERRIASLIDAGIGSCLATWKLRGMLDRMNAQLRFYTGKNTPEQKAYLFAWGEIDAEIRASKRPVRFLLDVLAIEPEILAMKKIILVGTCSFRCESSGVNPGEEQLDYTPAVPLKTFDYSPDVEIKLERYDADQGSEYRVWYLSTLKKAGDPNDPEILRQEPPDYILFPTNKLNI